MMNQGIQYTLRIGESTTVRSGIVKAKLSIVFAGHLDASTYSIAVLWSMGNNSMAYNLYLPNTQKEVDLLKGRLVRMNVTPDRLYFEFQE